MQKKLSESEILKSLQAKFTGMALEPVDAENGENYLFVPGDKIDEIVTFMKSDAALSFDYLVNVSAVDTKEVIEVTYHFYSYEHRHAITLKVKAPRTGAVVNSLVALYGTANWQEREVFDHFGVTFKNHPDLRRILLPDDWVGYPLLKDYQEQEEYNGMGTTRPSML